MSNHRWGVGLSILALTPVQWGRWPPPCEKVLLTVDPMPSGPPLSSRCRLSPADYQLQVQEIHQALTDHLRNRILKDDDNQRLLNGIGLHQDRGNLLCFLRVEGLEPTNNRAEPASVRR